MANYFNLENEIDLYMGTFSKSLGSIGGFISAKSKITEYIRHKASAFIFTAALPPASVAGVTKGLEIMISEPDRINRLRENLGVTSVVVTHDMISALTVGDRIAMLHMGEVVEVSTPEEFLNSEHPEVRKFLDAQYISRDFLKERQFSE